MAELLKNRSSLRITLGAIPEEAVERVITAVARETGERPHVDYPAQTLEQFFLAVIAKARQAGGETTRDCRIAGFLRGDGAGAETGGPGKQKPE